MTAIRQSIVRERQHAVRARYLLAFFGIQWIPTNKPSRCESLETGRCSNASNVIDLANIVGVLRCFQSSFTESQEKGSCSKMGELCSAFSWETAQPSWKSTTVSAVSLHKDAMVDDMQGTPARNGSVCLTGSI